MKRIFVLIIVVLVSGVGVFLYFILKDTKTTSPDRSDGIDTVVDLSDSDSLVAEPAVDSYSEAEYGFREIVIVSDDPGAELVERFGLDNTLTILAINRIDDQHLTQGMKLVAPVSFKDPSLWRFMPEEVESAKDIPKLVIISQRTQAFGFYENGQLSRSGPVSSGKQSTQTQSELYFTNWKGREVISTFNNEWIMKWNFNIDNETGVSLHQYALPGYPASHSCVRLYEEDARWLYHWADEWVVTLDGRTKLANGTPVIIYGSYDFGIEAPWKKLPTNLAAIRVSQEELDQVVKDHIVEING